MRFFTFSAIAILGLVASIIRNASKNSPERVCVPSSLNNPFCFPAKEISSQAGSNSDSSSEDTSSSEDSSSSNEEQEESILFNATSSSEAALYFRAYSLGDYDGTTFNEIDNSFDSSTSIINPMYLTSKALETSGYKTSDVIIEVIDGGCYFIPYYTTNGPANDNDYILLADFTSPYSLS